MDRRAHRGLFLAMVTVCAGSTISPKNQEESTAQARTHKEKLSASLLTVRKTLRHPFGSPLFVWLQFYALRSRKQ
jgi:hypothetical protein